MFFAIPLLLHTLAAASPAEIYGACRAWALPRWSEMDATDQSALRARLRKALPMPIFRAAGPQCLFDTTFLHAVAEDVDSLNQAALALPPPAALALRKMRLEFDPDAYFQSLRGLTWPASQLDSESQRLAALREMSRSYFLLGLEK